MNHRQQGFNLVEVLIAMVVLAIGLLGIAGLQLTGVRASQSSYFRSQAAAIMNDMAERMRNNVPGVNLQQYSGLISGTTCGGAPRICAHENGTAANTCTPQQMAAYDFYTVSCGMSNGGSRVDRLFDLLPNGIIRVDCINNATPPVIVTGANCVVGFRHRITVTWDERTQVNDQNVSSTQTQTITMLVQP